MSDDVYFIRHKSAEGTDFSECLIKELKKKHCIAIQFENKKFSEMVENFNYDGDKISYKSFQGIENERAYKIALECFWELGKNGGIVVAKYNDDNTFLIGKVPKEAKVEPFNEIKIALKLEDVKEINVQDYPLLNVGLGRGTIFRPHSNPFYKKLVPIIFNTEKGSEKEELNQEIEKIIKNSKENKSGEARKLLHHKILEQLCLEYLRLKHRFSYCVLAVGGTAQTIDILGVDKEGKKICAQVKADKIDKKDHEEFKGYVKKSKESNNFIFCEKAGKLEGKDEKNIKYLDVNEVFLELYDKKPQMIKNMIGFF